MFQWISFSITVASFAYPEGLSGNISHTCTSEEKNFEIIGMWKLHESETRMTGKHRADQQVWPLNLMQANKATTYQVFKGQCASVLFLCFHYSVNSLRHENCTHQQKQNIIIKLKELST